MVPMNRGDRRRCSRGIGLNKKKWCILSATVLAGTRGHNLEHKSVILSEAKDPTFLYRPERTIGSFASFRMTLSEADDTSVGCRIPAKS